MLIFRTIVLLFGLLALTNTECRAEWRRMDSGTLAWLHAVQFLDSRTGFAAGSNGTLLRTGDGGSTWSPIRLPVADVIREVHFFDPLSGVLLCDRGRSRPGQKATYLLRTVDGGRNWTTEEIGNTAVRLSRFFVGDGGVLYLIGEGGVVVQLASRETKELLHRLPSRYRMIDGATAGSRIIVVGGGASLMLSEDGGFNWQVPRFEGSAPERRFNAVSFVDALAGWTCGNAGAMFATLDGGRSWSHQQTGTNSDIQDVNFLDRHIGIAVGERGLVVRSSDGGSSWTIENSGTKHRLERSAFAGRRAVAVGFGGSILVSDLP